MPRPPPAEPVSLLRGGDAGEIDPDDFYSVRLPDRSLMLFTGATLARASGLVAGLADAMRAWDGPRVDEALAAIRAVDDEVGGGRGPRLIVCERDGAEGRRAAPGCPTVDCAGCGAAARITPENHARSASAVILCVDCVRSGARKRGA